MTDSYDCESLSRLVSISLANTLCDLEDPQGDFRGVINWLKDDKDAEMPKVFIIHGSSSSGKSTLARTISNLIGATLLDDFRPAQDGNYVIVIPGNAQVEVIETKAVGSIAAEPVFHDSYGHVCSREDLDYEGLFD